MSFIERKFINSNLITVLSLFLLCSSAFAQNTSTIEVFKGDAISSKGIRISLLKPSSDYRGTAKYQNFSIDGSGSFDSALGLGIGYANIPIQELGWTTNLALIEVKKDTSAKIIRADGNLGTAVNSFVNLKAGLNIMKLTSGTNVEELDPGLGFQASVGLQINKNFGLDLGYTEMNTSGKVPITSNGKEIGQADLTYKLSGVEISINGTF